jgi:hypothetical protein
VRKRPGNAHVHSVQQVRGDEHCCGAGLAVCHWLYFIRCVLPRSASPLAAAARCTHACTCTCTCACACACAWGRARGADRLRLRVGAGKRCRSVPQLTVVPVTALAWTTVCTPVVLPPVPRWPSLLGPLAAVTSDCCDMDCGGLGTERGGGHALPFARRLLRAARCASCACGAAMGAAIFGTFLGPVVDKYGRRCVPSPLLSCPVFRRLIPTPETLNPKH